MELKEAILKIQQVLWEVVQRATIKTSLRLIFQQFMQIRFFNTTLRLVNL
jgi:hypothetical protein